MGRRETPDPLAGRVEGGGAVTGQLSYRQDESHNIARGGYGIGLSIAESICENCGGSIEAVWRDGVISFICQLY